MFQVDTVTINPELVNVTVSGMSILGTVGASVLLGLAKKYIIPVDSKLLNIFKPFQPILTTVLPPVFALIFSALGWASQEDAATLFAAAPASAIIVITLREGLQRIVGAKRG